MTNLPSESVNAVTWGVFPGKEVAQSTMIEQVSFLAWKVYPSPPFCLLPHNLLILNLSLTPPQEEAYQIWLEWSALYPVGSASRKLLEGIVDGHWLVTIVHHDYKRPDGLWEWLTEEDV